MDCSYYRPSWTINIRPEDMALRSVTCIIKSTETDSETTKASIVPKEEAEWNILNHPKGLSASFLKS